MLLGWLRPEKKNREETGGRIAAPSQVDFESWLVESPTFFFGWSYGKPSRSFGQWTFSPPLQPVVLYLFFENTFDFTRPHFSRLFSSILFSPLFFLCALPAHQTRRRGSLTWVGRRGRRYCLYPFPFLFLIFSVSPLASISLPPPFWKKKEK